MAFQFSVRLREEADEEEGRSLFRTHLSHCGFREETAPCGTQGLLSKRPEPYHVGQEQLHSGWLGTEGYKHRITQIDTRHSKQMKAAYHQEVGASQETRKGTNPPFIISSARRRFRRKNPSLMRKLLWLSALSYDHGEYLRIHWFNSAHYFIFTEENWRWNTGLCL